MTPFEVNAALEKLVLLVDTREQDTLSFRRRMKEVEMPYTRQKLDFGDYSAKCTTDDGKELDFSGSIAIERKMNLDELCLCYTKERKRFTKEFERAKEAGAKLYLLVENGTWEKAIEGKYRSQMNSKAFLASLIAWLARYNCQVIFCEARTSARLIHEILYREVKERLEGM
ncbi:MAG: ERCC4 domain-containing protein [Lachnospiraceae bacterium]|jgi:ERCC4-type nuclease